MWGKVSLGNGWNWGNLEETAFDSATLFWNNAWGNTNRSDCVAQQQKDLVANKDTMKPPAQYNKWKLVMRRKCPAEQSIGNLAWRKLSFSSVFFCNSIKCVYSLNGFFKLKSDTLSFIGATPKAMHLPTTYKDKWVVFLRPKVTIEEHLVK